MRHFQVYTLILLASLSASIGHTFGLKGLDSEKVRRSDITEAVAECLECYEASKDPSFANFTQLKYSPVAPEDLRHDIRILSKRDVTSGIQSEQSEQFQDPRRPIDSQKYGLTGIGIIESKMGSVSAPATAFLVDGCHILTTRHSTKKELFISRGADPKASLTHTFHVGLGNDQQRPFSYRLPVEVVAQPDNEASDWTILRIRDTSNLSGIKPLKLVDPKIDLNETYGYGPKRDGKVSQGLPIVTAGFPNDKMKEPRISLWGELTKSVYNKDEKSLKIENGGNFCNLYNVGAGSISHSCSIAGGASGSPLMRYNQATGEFEVIGINSIGFGDEKVLASYSQVLKTNNPSGSLNLAEPISQELRDKLARLPSCDIQVAQK